VSVKIPSCTRTWNRTNRGMHKRVDGSEVCAAISLM